MRVAFGWVRRAAAIPRDKRGLDAAGVRRRSRGLTAAIARRRRAAGRPAEGLAHPLKVTRSEWAGLPRCHGVEGPPRTNNAPEQFLGSYRYRERRRSGRKVPSAGTAARGSARLVAAAATRLRPIEAAGLAPSDQAAWRSLRQRLARRQAVRTLGRRLRSDPVAYLRSLGESLIKAVVLP